MNYQKLKDRWNKSKIYQQNYSYEIKSLILSKGQPVFIKYNIQRVFLFGSIIEGRMKKGSDIDMLVIPLSKKDYWDFQFELEQVTNCSIDLYTQNDDSNFVKKY